MITTEQFKNSLGSTGEYMDAEEIQKLMSLFDQLTSYWLDEREIKLFGGTIKTILEE